MNNRSSRIINQYRTLGPLAISLLFCVAIFIWASPRGYDVTDDANALIWAAAPFQYFYTVSEAGHIWHPIYLLAGGDVGIFRTLGALLLCGCGFVFGGALARFTASKFSRGIHIRIILLFAICVFWQYGAMPRTPNYNTLNLLSLLLFVSALLWAGANANRTNPSRMSWVGDLSAAALAGAALAGTILSKPTSGLFAGFFAILWAVFFRPRNLWLTICAGAISTLIFLFIATSVIFGGIGGFLEHFPVALHLLEKNSGGGQVNTLINSILGPFLEERRSRIPPALLFGGIILIVSYFAIELAGRSKSGWTIRKFLAAIFAFSICLFCAWWRSEETARVITYSGFHAWRFALLMIFGAVAIFAGRSRLNLHDRDIRKTLIAVFFLLSVPAIYSFGTNTQLVLHMSGAAIFWAAGTVLLVSVIAPDRRETVLNVVTALCAFATVGVLIGAMATPIRINRPIWQQTQAISVGANGANILVDSPTAEYIRTLQSAAKNNGFITNMPIIDLSGAGPGMVFALGARASGTPWLVDGPLGAYQYYEEVLHRVPYEDLRKSWLLTTREGDKLKYSAVLKNVGLNFPSGYELVGQAKRADVGWMQQLWKPVP